MKREVQNVHLESGKLQASSNRDYQVKRSDATKIKTLTNREIEIIHLIVDEYTAKEIASALFISCHTVERHRKNIKAKLKVRNVAGMVRAAFEIGICQSRIKSSL